MELQEYTVYFPKVSGLNEGDMVVTAGVQKLREGQKVRTNDDAVGDASWKI